VVAVSIQPSSHPGRSDFPSPVGGDSFFHGSASARSQRFKGSIPYAVGSACYPSRFAARWPSTARVRFCARVRRPPHSHCPPRAPLRLKRHCRSRPALLAQVGERYPAFFAPTGSCARPHGSRRLRSSLFLRVLAGCFESLLPCDPSRRYLCDPCTGAWVRTPPRSSGASVRFFPPGFGLAQGSTGSARGTLPQRSFTRGGDFGAATIRSRSGSVTRLAHRLLRRSGHVSLPPLGRIRRAEPRPLPVPGCGIATCPNRTTDTIELTDALASIHLLDRSLVGCS